MNVLLLFFTTLVALMISIFVYFERDNYNAQRHTSIATFDFFYPAWWWINSNLIILFLSLSNWENQLKPHYKWHWKLLGPPWPMLPAMWGPYVWTHLNNCLCLFKIWGFIFKGPEWQELRIYLKKSTLDLSYLVSCYRTSRVFFVLASHAFAILRLFHF